jgi:hypothetical protein
MHSSSKSLGREDVDFAQLFPTLNMEALKWVSFMLFLCNPHFFLVKKGETMFNLCCVYPSTYVEIPIFDLRQFLAIVLLFFRLRE